MSKRWIPMLVLLLACSGDDTEGGSPDVVGSTGDGGSVADPSGVDAGGASAPSAVTDPEGSAGSDPQGEDLGGPDGGGGDGSTPGGDEPDDCTIETNSELFRDFMDARESGREPILPDFSYAGYHFQERDIPQDPPGPRFDVTDYGAIADDGEYDEAGIRAAIDAASDAGGGVVVFPAGRFEIGSNDDPDDVIEIRASGVVLQGDGRGEGGTEIFLDNMKIRGWHIRFRGSSSSATIATIVEDAARESFWLTTDTDHAAEPGDWVVIRHQSPEFAVEYFAPQTIGSEWTRLHESGLAIEELHRIAEVDGARLRLAEPLHFSLPANVGEFVLRTYAPLQEVGVEDMAIVGNWDSYPEEFDHHKDDIHDYAWNGVRMDRVANSWVRRVEFRNLNQGLYFDRSAAVTVDDTRYTGKKGHASVHTRRGYGVLVQDSVEEAGDHHGPGLGYSGVGTVYLRHQMLPSQSMDSHSGTPYASLFDDVLGGVIRGNGGPHEGYPHHGRDLVFWNFAHRGGSDISYQFWNTERRQSATFAMPTFAGFTSDREVTFADETNSVQANESRGTPVTPKSLFEAQLRLRRCADAATSGTQQ